MTPLSLTLFDIANKPWYGSRSGREKEDRPCLHFALVAGGFFTGAEQNSAGSSPCCKFDRSAAEIICATRCELLVFSTT